MTHASIAHSNDPHALQYFKRQPVPWKPAHPSDLDNGVFFSDLRRCAYCGSMHPSDVVAALAAGAESEWADQKYGWPHKFYVDRVPNPYAGQDCVTTTQSAEHPDWRRLPTGKFNPATGAPEFIWGYVESEPATVMKKFYTVHLQDATPEEREVIERAMGRSFDFTVNGEIRWRKL